MKKVKQVRLSGLGGQGIVLAGLLLGQAGVMEGSHISGSNSYGAQARGSECKAEIVFSDGPIDFPHVIRADFLVAMSQGAYDRYCEDIRMESGLIVYDQGLVSPKVDLRVRQLGVPATEMSVKKLKNKQMANIILLGFFAETTKMVSTGSLRKAVVLHGGRGFQSLNLKALQIGKDLGRRSNG